MGNIPLFKVHMPASAVGDLSTTLESGHIAQGKQVLDFEAGLAAHFGTSRLCVVNEASAGLTLALYLAGVRPGDEVIVSPLSCLATTMPVVNLFAKPVWCDVNPATGMPDAAHLSARMSERTRAVIFYYWSGDAADLGPLHNVLNGVPVVADASEAMGAEFHGRSLALSTGADFTVYSFSAVRHMTTGEGGALICGSRIDLDLVRRTRRYGIDQASFRLSNGDLNPDSDIAAPGFAFAMNNIASTLGLAQLPHLPSVVQRHRANGAYFDRVLGGTPGVKLLRRPANAVSAYWTYSLRVERRKDLMRKLHQNGVGAQRLHVRNDRYSCFSASSNAQDLPGVDIFDRENLAIPCGWWLSEAEREHIAGCIRSGW